MLIAVHCPICRTTSSIEVPADGYERWQNGELIQNAMPDVSIAVREQLLTGIDDACWQSMWTDGEEDESYEDNPSKNY